MKIYLLSCLFIISTNIYAQDMSCEEKVNTLLIDKIKTYNSTDLIPYFSSKRNKWGYFDRKTGKKITKPILKNAVFFQPQINLYYDLETNGKENGCDITLQGSQANYQITKIESSYYGLYGKEYEPEYKEPYSNFINDKIPGFEVNEQGKITYFNSKFYNAQESKPYFSDFAIKYHDKYYAIISQTINGSNSYAIIDQNGNIMPGFENIKNYPDRKISYKGDDDLWFLINIGNEKYKFKSLLHNKELPETFDASYNWENHSQSIAYAILSVNNEYGLMDLVTMQWKIKPSIKNDFSYLHYASLEKLSAEYINDYNVINNNLEIPIEVINKNRTNANVYIQTKNKQFYDLNLKLYFQKN